MDPDKRIDRIRRVCRRGQLPEGGIAVRFAITRQGRELPAFAIAYAGEVYAYVNICPHRGTTLDWQPGEVFDESGLYLICATHGALFEPGTGICVAGPCQGACLQKIPVRLEAGNVVLERDVLSNFKDE
ncbi:MAG: Rieske 2Fe-2S domain-containing protein [Betaproteobacteria bacterium]